MYTTQKSKVIKVISGTIGEALSINGNLCRFYGMRPMTKNLATAKCNIRYWSHWINAGINSKEK